MFQPTAIFVGLGLSPATPDLLPAALLQPQSPAKGQPVPANRPPPEGDNFHSVALGYCSVALARQQHQSAVVNPATPAKRCKRIDKDELNIRIKRYLGLHPGAAIRKVADELGVWPGTVHATDAWRQEMGRRKAAKRPPKKDARSLTRKMLESIGTDDNMDAVDARIEAEDVLWRQTLEESDEAGRAKLFAMTKPQKDEFIKLLAQQRADRLATEGDE
jgi:hypothetical protein